MLFLLKLLSFKHLSWFQLKLWQHPTHLPMKCYTNGLDEQYSSLWKNKSYKIFLIKPFDFEILIILKFDKHCISNWHLQISSLSHSPLNLLNHLYVKLRMSQLNADKPAGFVSEFPKANWNKKNFLLEFSSPKLKESDRREMSTLSSMCCT